VNDKQGGSARSDAKNSALLEYKRAWPNDAVIISCPSLFVKPKRQNRKMFLYAKKTDSINASFHPVHLANMPDLCRPSILNRRHGRVLAQESSLSPSKFPL
jgi:hypothetical protein